jgi:hypothetical protein
MNSNLCRHLRTKKLYMDSMEHEAFVQKTGENASACHYWCCLTQAVAGPDDRPAHTENSTRGKGRTCFEE